MPRASVPVWPGLVSSEQRSADLHDDDESVGIGWSDLITVCAAGAAGWALILAACWYLVGVFGVGFPL